MDIDQNTVQPEQQFYDIIIIGAGTAGFSTAQYAARSNLETLVIETSVCGGQALNIFQLENYPGIYPSVTGGDFVMTLKNQAEAFGANIVKTQVSSIDKKGDKFLLTTKNGTFSSYTVCICTGAEHTKLGIPGEDKFSGSGVSYCAACDGPFFRKRRIAVIGGGDSACDEASYLATLTDKVTLIHRKGSFRAQKAVAERVLNNPNITVMFNTVAEEIEGGYRPEKLRLRNVLTNEVSSIDVDGVFIFIGMKPQTALVDMLAKDKDGYIVTNEEMATSIPGIFCAGDIRSKPFRQLITAASDGAVAAHSAAQYIRSLKNEVYV